MISFVIPALNEEKVIKKILLNLKEIKNFDYEIIVSDGGSTDSTVALAKTLARVVENKPGHRQTIAEGRNAGAFEAKGEYIVLLDADVHIFNPDKFFARALEYFNRETSLVALAVFLKVLPEYATLADKVFFTLANWQKFIFNNVFSIGTATGEFQMIRANVFRQLGGYNPKLVVSEDDEFFARLSKIGKTRVVPDLYVYHTSRRAHKIGWSKLLWLWWVNLFYIKFFKKSYSKEWKVIR